MFTIIAFIVAVIFWDSLKKRIRGKPKIKVMLPQTFSAECGCVIRNDCMKIESTCQAHKLLRELINDRK